MAKKKDQLTREMHYAHRRKLNAEEQTALNGEMAAMMEEIDRCESEHEHFNESAKRAKARAKEFDAKLKAKVAEHLDGEIFEELMCRAVFDYSTGHVEYFHPETGEHLHTRPMNEREQQRQLDFEEAPSNEAENPEGEPVPVEFEDVTESQEEAQ